MSLDRRTLFAAAAAMLSGGGPSRAETGPAPGTNLDVIDLWPGLPPGGGGPVAADGRFDESRDGVIGNVARPCLLVMRAEKPNGAALVIAAGGGYRRIDIGNEGIPVARWLAGVGISAFVLIYRLPAEGWAAGADAPLQDVQRAIRLVRAGAPGYGIDPERIGVLGFSAGGHLMGEAAMRAAAQTYAPLDASDALSARPELAGLIYPVITLRPPFDRTSTRRILAGDPPDPARAALYSVDTHVRERAPPTFLAQAADDPITVVDNSLLMYSALRGALVPTELHLFERGGHGFGLGVPGSPAAAWSGLFLTWMKRRGFLRA